MYMNATKSTDRVCNKLPLKQFHLHKFYHPAREVDRQPSYPARPLARPGAIRHTYRHLCNEILPVVAIKTFNYINYSDTFKNA
jgi:hypothetical protein